MSEVKIMDRLTVAGQPAPQAFRDIAAKGFATLVNLRPDGEEPGQPGNAVERTAAAGARMAYGFVPVTGPTIGRADVEAFRDVMRRSDGPVYAHCKGGTRALTLYALSEVLDGRMKREEVEAFGKQHGFDLSGAARWLAREAKRVPEVTGFYDPRTFSIQYVVTDPATKRCALIDPVLDFDEKSGAVTTTSADALLAHVEKEGLTVEWILDTHPHADHFSAAHYLKGKTGALSAIGANITAVQALWKDIYNWPDMKTDGSYWDGCLPPATPSISARWKAACCFRPATRWPRSPMSWATPPSCTTPSSCRIPAPRAPTSLAAAPRRCGRLFRRSSLCRTRRGCSPGTTTSPADGRRNGKALWASRSAPTRISPARTKKHTWRYARRATGPCRCRS